MLIEEESELPDAVSAGMRRRWTLLLGIIALFFAFSVAVAWQLAVIYGQISHREGKNVLWTLTQAQNQGEKLARMDEQFRQGLVTRDKLVEQEDVFFSRLALLDDGPQRRLLMHFGIHEMVMSAVELFRKANPVSLTELPRSSDAHEYLVALIDVLAKAGNDAMVREREERSQQFEDFVGLIRIAFVAFAAVLVTGGVLVWQLLASLSHQRRQLRINAEQRAALQQTVDDLNEAQRAAETYRNFVSLVSHQFRGPLAVLDSTAQRLMRSVRDDTSSGFAESQLVIDKMSLARSTIENMNKLIDAVLASVRLEKGAIQLQMQQMNLCELVGQVVVSQTPMLHDRPLLLETDGDVSHYACMGDPDLLEHVLQNLISNVCKYTHPGTPISVTLTRAGYGTLVCTVRDWGDGVTESELPYLFERFYRSSTSLPAEGTGLGLYLARSIARLHGGNLVGSLPEGGGLAVHLRIPALHMRTPSATQSLV